MKKLILYLLLVLFTSSLLYSQKVELAASYKFGEPFDYWTKWDPNEGISPSFKIEFVTENNEFIANSIENGKWYRLGLDGSSEEYFGLQTFDRYRTDIFCSSFYNGYLVGYNENLSDRNEIHVKLHLNGKEIEIFREDGSSMYNCYFTGNVLIFGNASIEFLTDGSYKIRNATETESWLKNGKGEELGYIIDEWSSICFGDVDLSTVDNFYKDSCFKNAHEDEIIGAAFDALWDSPYNNFAKDSKGLIYFRRIQSDNGKVTNYQPAPNIKFNIAILDPWTKQVKYYEDYAPNEYNPPRNADGIIIGSYSWTVAPDGNIYFTDADVEKGEYQIKRVINRWWDDMGIKDRIIGQMNTNHIPLLTTMNGSQNDGYCFENDFVWVTEQSTDKTWSKIKKIDGREGWIETKYIDINTMVPVTNASLGITIDQSPATTAAVSAAKILKAADNLRLRKTELTSSEVITTMLKGTPVKIVATGRKETIDGITGNWVQVEVQSGGKDRNGSPIPAGTTGWCFGGYLE